MKKRVITILLVVALVMGMVCSASAVRSAPVLKGSTHFSMTQVNLTNQGGGKMKVTAKVTSTKLMTTLGPASIVIYQQQSNGSYKQYKSFTGGMFISNGYLCVVNKTFNVARGVKYYATVTFYARHSTMGATVKYHSSGCVKAT